MRLFGTIFGAVLLAGILVVGVFRLLEGGDKMSAQLDATAAKLLTAAKRDLADHAVRPAERVKASLRRTEQTLRDYAASGSVPRLRREECARMADEIAAALKDSPTPAAR